MIVKMRPLIVGTATLVPGFRNLTARQTGGTISARYCYSVWMRHLMLLRAHGLPTTFAAVAELGPGDSLGVGLAALLSGAERYVALDIARYAENERNLAIFDALIDLFRDRTPIPDEREFPLVRPLLASYAFPEDYLTERRLRDALDPERLRVIRDALRHPDRGHGTGRMIAFVAPWDDAGAIAAGSVDLILSQAVLEYPPQLAETYAAMHRWLKPGGAMSHLIDFKCHGLTTEWNGHWACADSLWRLLGGRRRDTLNRAPHSEHLDLLRRCGFRIVADVRTLTRSTLARDDLIPRFRYLTDDDLTTSVALMQSVKVA
jgi:hypothetical protein